MKASKFNISSPGFNDGPSSPKYTLLGSQNGHSRVSSLFVRSHCPRHLAQSSASRIPYHQFQSCRLKTTRGKGGQVCWMIDIKVLYFYIRLSIMIQSKFSKITLYMPLRKCYHNSSGQIPSCRIGYGTAAIASD
jgi:hypothetical protein